MRGSHANSSETTRETFQSTGLSKNWTKGCFNQWLVGVVDGCGSFHFNEEAPGKWSIYLKVTQSSYNIQILHYIKRNVGYGQVVRSGNMAIFRIRDCETILRVIIPIFDKYPILTSKYYYYDLFKKAVVVMCDTTLSTTVKNEYLNDLKSHNESIPNNYYSPAWRVVNFDIKTMSDALQVMHKSWVIGFTETIGNFYIISKNESLVHGFSVTHKLDPIVLRGLSYILDAKFAENKTSYSVVTTNTWNYSNIINYFKNTMVGIKSLEFRIWARSYNKVHNKEKSDYRIKVQAQLRNIRNKGAMYHSKYK